MNPASAWASARWRWVAALPVPNDLQADTLAAKPLAFRVREDQGHLGARGRLLYRGDVVAATLQGSGAWPRPPWPGTSPAGPRRRGLRKRRWTAPPSRSRRTEQPPGRRAVAAWQTPSTRPSKLEVGPSRGVTRRGPRATRRGLCSAGWRAAKLGDGPQLQRPPVMTRPARPVGQWLLASRSAILAAKRYTLPSRRERGKCGACRRIGRASRLRGPTCRRDLWGDAEGTMGQLPVSARHEMRGPPPRGRLRAAPRHG